MRAHYIQHVPFEGLGSIEAWLHTNHYDITSTKLYDGEILPAITGIDLLIVLGGPMSVNDERTYPWLILEKNFINKMINAGKSVLGICLGAQLIANSMGCEVFPNTLKEIGWFPVKGLTSKSDSTFHFPEEITVFHWHGETFNLPIGAVHLAESKTCKNQAFQIGSHVIGLQFHLETTSITAQGIVHNCRDELTEEQFIQSEEEILSAPKEQYSSINNLMINILDYLKSCNK